MNNTYIIGEIGQNHNGSVDIAKLLVDLITRPVKEEHFNINLRPMDAIKLTKRDLNHELTVSAMNKPYNSPHSFGKTYGEHRNVLELTDEEHFEVYKHAKTKKIEVIETICSPQAMSFMKYFYPDKIKVASRDLTNLPLLQALSETKIPIIVSTGMAGIDELNNALDVITKYHNEISILHCTSEYPTRPENVNLSSIKYLLDNYSKYTIGFSDHTIGISTPLCAVAMGAKIIEKHVTIDRRMKGTDQAGSLGPDGVLRMVRDIRLLELSYGREELFIDPVTESARIKLERSIAANKNIDIGSIIKETDIHLLSPGDGFKWNEKNMVLGKKAIKKINKNEIIYKDNLSEN